MTYNDYKNDLMDNYGAIDRVWKIDGDKLIRVDGEGVEQYFYDLHISQKNGFWALFDEVKNFNLVYNKQIIKLNLFQRYKLFGLLNDKVDHIKSLNRVKKQMSDFEKMAKKGYHRTVEGGKQVAKAIRNQRGSIPGVISEIIENNREKDKKKSDWVGLGGTVSGNNQTNESNDRFKFDYEELKKRYQLQLKIELENQRTANDLDVQYVNDQKSKFQKRLEEMAKKRLDNSVSVEDIKNRFNSGR